MENRKEEHIIEDLLFEISAREVLAKSAQASTSVIHPIRKYLAYAAVFLALIATLLILNRGGSSMDDRLQIANHTYTYPQLSLSRSAERSIIDDYLAAFNGKEVDEVIQVLKGQNLNEKDRHALAHAYYHKGSLEEAKAVILEKNCRTMYINPTWTFCSSSSPMFRMKRKKLICTSPDLVIRTLKKRRRY